MLILCSGAFKNEFNTAIIIPPIFQTNYNKIKCHTDHDDDDE